MFKWNILVQADKISIYEEHKKMLFNIYPNLLFWCKTSHLW